METITINNTVLDIVEVFTDVVLLQNPEDKTLILLPYFVIESYTQPELKLVGKVISIRGSKCRRKTNTPQT
jgi:hypothetical protein